LNVKALVTVFVALVAAGSGAAAAQDSTPTPAPTAAPEGTPVATPSAAPSPDAVAPPAPEQRLVVHGYLSQASVKSDEHQVIGIPKDGTADYRRAALLFRASLTTSDAIVLQFAQRRLGESPTMQVEPDVKVDWAFYEHRFGSATRFRVGRLPVPLGIFSEIRYVGTLLPLYRAPYNYYQEGSFTSENLDGAHLSHTIGSGAPVSVDLNAFGGAYTTTESYNGGVNRAKAQNVFGGAAWIGTPVEGLRFGIGGARQDIKNTILTADHKDDWSNWIASAELVRTRFRVVTEYSRWKLNRAGFAKRNMSVYAGVGLTSKVRAHAAYDDGDATLLVGGKLYSLPQQFTDAALGLSYGLRPDVVAKAEYHWNQARLIEDKPSTLNPAASPYKTQYFIVSLSASF
jgi:hypothetical protein